MARKREVYPNITSLVSAWAEGAESGRIGTGYLKIQGDWLLMDKVSVYSSQRYDYTQRRWVTSHKHNELYVPVAVKYNDRLIIKDHTYVQHRGYLHYIQPPNKTGQWYTYGSPGVEKFNVVVANGLLKVCADDDGKFLTKPTHQNILDFAYASAVGRIMASNTDRSFASPMLRELCRRETEEVNNIMKAIGSRRRVDFEKQFVHGAVEQSLAVRHLKGEKV